MPANSTEGHTPTPWELVPGCEHHGAYITSQFGTTLCDLYAMSDPSSLSVRNGGTSKPIPFIDSEANAELIVRAVNNHDPLVAALRNQRVFMADELEQRRESNLAPYIKKAEDALAQIDAALKAVSASPVGERGEI